MDIKTSKKYQLVYTSLAPLQVLILVIVIESVAHVAMVKSRDL